MTDGENKNTEKGALKLPIGLNYGGRSYLDLPVARTGADAEKIYTKKPKQGKQYTWIAEVLATSIDNIGGEEVASVFNASKDKKIPSVIKQIPFLDAGGLMIQIQRECWEETIEDQRLKCPDCGASLSADIELNRIEVPENETGVAQTHYNVDFDEPITLFADQELLHDFKGQQFNRMVFRTVTLGDAINHEGLAKDEVAFWRELAFNTLERLEYVEDGQVIDVVPKNYLALRGKLFFTKDFTTKKLKEIRKGMISTQDSVKTYYEDDCSECGSKIPFFAQVNHFFQT